MPPLAGAIGTIGAIGTGIGAIGGLLGGGGGRQQTTTTTLSPQQQAQQQFVSGLSRQAAQQAQNFQALGPGAGQQQALAGLQGLGTQFGQFNQGLIASTVPMKFSVRTKSLLKQGVQTRPITVTKINDHDSQGFTGDRRVACKFANC